MIVPSVQMEPELRKAKGLHTTPPSRPTLHSPMGAQCPVLTRTSREVVSGSAAPRRHWRFAASALAQAGSGALRLSAAAL
jgi:hypothetical protein